MAFELFGGLGSLLKPRKGDLFARIKRFTIGLKESPEGGFEFERKYTVFRVGVRRITVQGLSWAAKEGKRYELLSRLEEDPRVLSVCTEGSNVNAPDGFYFRCFVLVSSEYGEAVHRLLSDYEEAYSVGYAFKSFSSLNDRDREEYLSVIAKLLLNAVFKDFRRANLIGDFHSCGGDNVLIVKELSRGDMFVTLRFDIDQKCDIEARVQTYCRRGLFLMRCKDLTSRPRREVLRWPKFRRTEDTFVYERGEVDDNDPNVYLSRSLSRDRKNRYREFVRDMAKGDGTALVSLEDELDQSKTSYLEKVTQAIVELFGDCVSLEFQSVRLDFSVDGASFKRRALVTRQAFMRCFGLGSKVVIVNCLDRTDVNVRFIPMLVEMFQSFLDGSGVEVRVAAGDGDKPEPDALNVVLVHDAEYYEDAEDRYVDDEDIAVQHVTVETLQEFERKKSKGSVFRKRSPEDGGSERQVNPLVYVLLRELLTKRDILNSRFDSALPVELKEDGRFYTFVWRRLFKEYVKGEKNPKKIMLYFAIQFKDGKMKSFAGTQRDVFGAESSLDGKERLEKCLLRWNESNDPGSYLFSDGDSVLFVEKAGFTVMCDYGRIAEFVREGRGLRSSDARDSCFAGYYGFSSFILDGERYFMAGLMPDALTGTENIQTSVQPRVMHRLLGSSERAEMAERRLLSMMDTVFLYRDRFGVNPTPFKYLMEIYRAWCRHEGRGICEKDLAVSDSTDDGQDTDSCNGILPFMTDVGDSFAGFTGKSGKKQKESPVLGFHVGKKYKRQIERVARDVGLNKTGFLTLFHHIFMPSFLDSLNVARDKVDVLPIRSSEFLVFNKISSKKKD